jgi:hypothetical protein
LARYLVAQSECNIPPQAFPNLHILHMVRDGRDVAVSNVNSSSLRTIQTYQRHYVQTLAGECLLVGHCKEMRWVHFLARDCLMLVCFCMRPCVLKCLQSHTSPSIYSHNAAWPHCHQAARTMRVNWSQHHTQLPQHLHGPSSISTPKNGPRSTALVLLGATQLPGVYRGDLRCAQVHPTYRVLMPVTLVRTRLHDILTYYRLEDFCVTAGLESAVSRMLQNAGIPFNKTALARAARTLDPGRCETERWPVCACSPAVDALPAGVQGCCCFLGW